MSDPGDADSSPASAAEEEFETACQRVQLAFNNIERPDPQVLLVLWHEMRAAHCRAIEAARAEARRDGCAIAREQIARYIEETFGRCNLLAANGYLDGDDIAEEIRAGKTGDA